MDTIDGMRVFAAVVEQGSFTAAARRLGISTALASKYVRQLEDKFGAQLLVRSTRHVHPTDAGVIYADRCRVMVEQMDDLMDLAGKQSGQIVGHLRIAGPRIIGEELLSDCVREFLALHPTVTIDLRLEERKVDVISEGFDIAVRIGELQDSSLKAKKIAEYSYHLAASPEYLQENGVPKRPSDLRDHHCILGSTISPNNQLEFIENDSKTTVTIEPRARVNAARPIRDLALAGLGVGLCLSSTIANDLAEKRLELVLEDFNAYHRNVYMLFPERRYTSARVRAFLDHATDYFRRRA
ncbi:MAG: LysR family transcriptional regulator [Kordiimonadaceae bacterium]|nr:LysR family transcriptional regulator [Kordiimonadaceae bacterium]MBO6569057.1 LysR family transcriptional regulator [Kordiimonadaceae bacterium]MBO6964532.1 LysR family transcriptional regulator [Kordiimonadaceae bacterium]